MAIQDLLEHDSAAKALALLNQHYLPTHDQYTRALCADALAATGKTNDAITVYTAAAEQGGKRALSLWLRVFELQFAKHAIDDACTTLRYALSLEPYNMYLHIYAAHWLHAGGLSHQALCHARHISEQSANDAALELAQGIYTVLDMPLDAYRIAQKRHALAKHPHKLLGQLLGAAQSVCAWDAVAQYAHTLDEELYARGDFLTACESPYSHIARSADEVTNLAVARGAVQQLLTTEPAFDLNIPRSRDIMGRYRVGLLTADFGGPSLMQRVVGLLEYLDKRRFSLFAFDDGSTDPAAAPRQFVSLDRHIDVRGLSDEAVAQRIYDEGIDICIDFTGLLAKNRLGVLVMRPCPVTAVFLGFPGSCGLSSIDYAITDAIVTPDTSKPHYAEKLCRLPEIFMPSDIQRRIAAKPVTRREMGLPDDAVVLGSFNTACKLDATSVNLWMRILSRSPNAVLWQTAQDSSVRNAFLEAARQHAVNERRIIFAEMASSDPLHLARLELIDLGLDTLIFNGHTTTADMLWVGVPLIACKGSHFASRMSASLLHAVGLDDCITHTAQEMEDLVVALAAEPARCAKLRERLKHNKNRMPLFDIERYTRHFESALNMMLDRERKLLPPDHIDVPALPPRCPTGAGSGERTFFPYSPPHSMELNEGTQDRCFCGDMPAVNSVAQTPYGIPFGVCPLCRARASANGIPINIRAHPAWREPLPGTIFWQQCVQCGHRHAHAFWDSTALTILRQCIPVQITSLERIEARRSLAPVAEYVRTMLKVVKTGVPLQQHWLVADASSDEVAWAARSYGFQSMVFSCNEVIAQNLRKQGGYARGIDIVPADIKGTAHVLTLEGLDARPWPHLLLARAYELLEPRGIVHIPIQVFDNAHWQALSCNERLTCLSEPQRLHLFSSDNLIESMDKYGFTLEAAFQDASRSGGIHLLGRKR